MKNTTSSLSLALLLTFAGAAPAFAVDGITPSISSDFQHPQWQHAGFAHSDFNHDAARFQANTLVHRDLSQSSASTFRAAPETLSNLKMQNGLGTNDPTSPTQVSPFSDETQARFQNMRMKFEDPAFRKFDFN